MTPPPLPTSTRPLPDPPVLSPPPLPHHLLPGAGVVFRSPDANEGRRLVEQGLARVVAADVLVAANTSDSLAVRAEAAKLLLADRGGAPWVLGFASAAWLYAGAAATGGEPARLDVILVPGRRRPRSPVLRGRQVVLAREAVVTVHGVQVTGPVRTAADVARDLPPAQAIPALRRLGELTGVRPHQVLQVLTDMRYARGAANGRRVVRAWAAEP